MMGGLFSAASAMDSAAKVHEVTARNLASASIPGFRRSWTTMTPTFMPPSPEEPRKDDALAVGVRTEAPAADFTPGPLSDTGSPLDLALHGEGFFVVEGAQGPLYTRNGAFELTGTGDVVTADGLPVMAGGAPLVLPQEASLAEFRVTPEGVVFVGREEIGRLDIVSFDDNSRLESVGATLFSAPDDLPSQPATAAVVQGSRELSNVQPMSELIALIAAQRQYEAAHRSLRTIDDATRKHLEN